LVRPCPTRALRCTSGKPPKTTTGSTTAARYLAWLAEHTGYSLSDIEAEVAAHATGQAARPDDGGDPGESQAEPAGWQGTGRVVKVVPEGNSRGGYVLLRLSEGTRPAMLLAKNMTADLRSDLNHGHIDMDEEIDVEVLTVDPAHGKVLLRDLPEAGPDPVEVLKAA
jgi:hypothetical protein